MSQSSPSRGGRRVDYGNGAYGYERADGSEYYNDGHGYVRYVHPDPSRSWEQFEGEERRYGPLDGKIENGDDGEEEGSEERFEGEEGEHVGGYGYSEDKGEREAYDYVQGEEDDDGDRFALGYRPESEDAEMPDAPPPPCVACAFPARAHCLADRAVGIRNISLRRSSGLAALAITARQLHVRDRLRAGAIGEAGLLAGMARLVPWQALAAVGAPTRGRREGEDLELAEPAEEAESAVARSMRLLQP